MVGAGVVVFVAGLWFFRIPLAESLIKGQLAERGVASDFHIINLDFSGADVAAIRLGQESSPDLAIAGANLRLDWHGLSPRLGAVHLIQPRVRIQLDPREEEGRPVPERRREEARLAAPRRPGHV